MNLTEKQIAEFYLILSAHGSGWLMRKMKS